MQVIQSQIESGCAGGAAGEQTSMARGWDEGRTRGASCVSAGEGGRSATWRAGRESERRDRTLPNADSERLARRAGARTSTGWERCADAGARLGSRRGVQGERERGQNGDPGRDAGVRGGMI